MRILKSPITGGSVFPSAALGLTLALTTLSALGQVPPLKISAPARNAHGWTVQLTNIYTAAVTAYALKAGNGLGAGGGGVKWADSIPGDHGLRPQLPPGASAPVFVPGRGDQPPELFNSAVIYADGASAGDPAIVARFISMREFFLAEIPAALARMRATAADSGADRASLVSAYRQQAEDNISSLRAGLAGPVSDRISENIAATLANPANADVQATAAALVAALTRWQTQLWSSLPKLNVASPPPR